MYLRVIEGGLALAEPDAGSYTRQHVRNEAARRIKASGYERFRMREITTGDPIPRGLQYLKIQIDWVGETLCGLDPIPKDYDEDKYWPGLYR